MERAAQGMGASNAHRGRPFGIHPKWLMQLWPSGWRGYPPQPALEVGPDHQVAGFAEPLTDTSGTIYQQVDQKLADVRLEVRTLAERPGRRSGGTLDRHRRPLGRSSGSSKRPRRRRPSAPS